MSSRHIRGNLVYRSNYEHTIAGDITAVMIANSSLVLVNKASGAATAITLPAPSYVGQAWKIADAKGDAGTNNITITPASGTINGGATYVIGQNYGSVELVWDGTNYTVSADGGTSGSSGTGSFNAITAADSALGITGLAATSATGGSVVIAGGATTTSGVGGLVSHTGGAGSGASAGGAASLVGGAGGATGAGGAAAVTGGAGGATSGTGGAASMTGGAGTGTGATGGAVTVTAGAAGAGATTTAGGIGGAASLVATAGGAKAGTGAAAGGAGGAAGVTAGAGGATASSGTDAGGVGGDVTLTAGAGGAASAGTGNGGAGGSVIFVPGAGGTSAGGTAGKAGGNFLRSSTGMHFRQQTAATAKSDGDETITAAQMINGIVVFTITTGRSLTTPTGAAILAGCPADLAVGDSFDLTVITVGTGADDIATLTAGDGDVTFVGKVTVGPNIAEGGPDHGTWRFRYTGANAFVGYRIG
jgi:hypothetical protein